MTDIRNVAIIAHVDHGKTTLVDALLKQSKTHLGKNAPNTLIMDSNELERERGITIFSKNASLVWKDTKINIIDTPGHADFGGEVERVLTMADGCLLLVDAKEGPMPQTRFVLRQALSMKHKIIVVVNKIDRPDARVNDVLHEVLGLFLELGAEEDIADFPVVYASAKEGKAGLEPDLAAMKDISPVFESILENIPAPKADPAAPLAMLVSNITTDYSQSQKSNLKVLGDAHDFIGIEKWLNSEPISIKDLKGKVVLVDFWTYTCINCIRTLPYVTGWYEKYKDQGFVVIGVHTPEFEFEKKTGNVQNAIKQYKITYPVAQDNNYDTWNNYNNRYWPAKYLVDANGKIRYSHFGEGKYEETEKNIQSLLVEAGKSTNKEITTENNRPPFAIGSPPTPETYLGFKRLNNTQFASKENPSLGTKIYSTPSNLDKDQFAYEGHWMLSEEYAMASKNSALEINFLAQKVFLVIRPSAQEQQIRVLLDEKEVPLEDSATDIKNSTIILDTERLYNILDLNQKQNRKLRLEFQNDGIEVYAFTFG